MHVRMYSKGGTPSIAVIFPDVPGCAAWGENQEHAFAMAVDALAGHLEALTDDSDPIPVPSSYEAAWEGLCREIASYDMGPLPEGTLMHPVPAPELDTRTKQVAVSFSQ